MWKFEIDDNIYDATIAKFIEKYTEYERDYSLPNVDSIVCSFIIVIILLLNTNTNTNKS